MAVQLYPLNLNGWKELSSLIGYNQVNHSITDRLVKSLRLLGAKSFILENEYLDRDFTEAYSSYYSKLFKRHSKLCSRISFFREDVSSLSTIDDAKLRAKKLEELGKASFLGWAVVRPIHEAPIAKIVLLTAPLADKYEGHLLVKAEHVIHVLGAELKIYGSVMTQQDQRIGACAQAAIWSAARHFHLKHKGIWISTAGITEAAMTQSEWLASTTLPNGSEFLSLNGMVGALKSIGRKPLLYVADEMEPKIKWKDIRPADVVNRYIDSGIPVIVGLNLPESNIGHAVLATGQIFERPTKRNKPPSRPSRAEYCYGFYVNDDQHGVNLVMPISEKAIGADTSYSLAKNAAFLLIPLPDKVYVPAEKAELLAWDILKDNYASEWPTISKETEKLGKSLQLANKFVKAIDSNQVFARTYLTYGWKYNYRLARNANNNSFKQFAMSTELPRYVWITEFGTKDSFAHSDKFKRRIFSHCVVDATAKNMGTDSRLLFHAPGIALRNVHSQEIPAGPYQREVILIKDDSAYFPKLRGNDNFEGY